MPFRGWAGGHGWFSSRCLTRYSLSFQTGRNLQKLTPGKHNPPPPKGDLAQPTCSGCDKLGINCLRGSTTRFRHVSISTTSVVLLPNQSLCRYYHEVSVMTDRYVLIITAVRPMRRGAHPREASASQTTSPGSRQPALSALSTKQGISRPFTAATTTQTPAIMAVLKTNSACSRSRRRRQRQ